MKIFLLMGLLFPFYGLAQKADFRVETKTDTLVSCGEKFLIRTESRTLQLEKRIIDVSDLTITTLKPGKNAMVLAIKSLTEAEMRQWLLESEEQYSSERNYYERISETILELITAKSQTFEGAAHGDHWYENSFLDLKSNAGFDLNNIFDEPAFPVIYEFARKKLLQEYHELELTEPFKINHYTFTTEDFVISFHYLDSEKPIPVSYAQQAVEIYIPFKLLLPYIKKESVIYKMITGNSCR